MTLIASRADRTLSGLVLPFGEVGRTNLGKVKAHKGTLRAAPVVTLNTQHDKIHVGLAASLTEEDDGWHGIFNVADGPEGDQLLAEYEADKRRGLSVEMPDAVTRGGELIAGTITSVAAVIRGAFPSALMAADAGDLPADLPDWYAPSESSTESTEEITVDGVTYIRKNSTTNKSTLTRKGEEPEPTTEEDNMPDENEDGQQLSASLVAALGQALNAARVEEAPAPMSADAAFRGIATHYTKSGNLEAALASVTQDNPVSPGDGTGVGEIAGAPAWLGEVYKRAPYNRKFVPLLGAGAPLTSYKSNGYRITGLPTVAQYAGNLAEVPTGGLTVEPVDYTATRWAHGANLDRRFSDFGDNQVMEAFVEAQVDSYKRVSDAYALAQLVATATVQAPGEFVADTAPALTGIVDGALGLIADEFQPTGAIVGADLYRALLFTKKDDVSAFLTEAFGLEEGGLSGFRIVPTAAAALAGKTLVLDRSTVRMRELGGGTPVRVEAELPSNGGKTLAVFGYTSFEELVADGVRIVTPPLVAPAA